MAEIKKRQRVTIEVPIEESKLAKLASDLQIIVRNFSPADIGTIAKIAGNDIMKNEAVKAMREYVG